MAFEYHNPHPSNLECCIGRPIGSVIVEAGAVIPTPEMEDKGITADILEPFVSSNLLRPTPPAVRRRFLASEGMEIPADLAAATDHLTEFGGQPPPVPAQVVAPPTKSGPPVMRRQTRHTFAKEMESAMGMSRPSPSLGERAADPTQSLADKKCSSRSMRPSDPDSSGG
jgi:hypothetical protein